MPDPRECPDRWVRSLRGQVVTVTGAVKGDGWGMLRRECDQAIRRAGGDSKTDFSGRVTLLVEGNLDGKAVTDVNRGYSQKLVGAQEARSLGMPHVHVIDAEGFADLVNGTPAKCLNLKGSGRNVRVVAEPGGGVLGGPLVVHDAPVHEYASELAHDLSALDEGTAAHQRTLAAFKDYLDGYGIVARAPWRGAPAFDIGWNEDKHIFVGEVKSLRETNQAQQIRLGIGQVLDYAQLLTDSGHKVQPVLILEREPESPHWDRLATVHGILLTYGPHFPGV